MSKYVVLDGERYNNKLLTIFEKLYFYDCLQRFRLIFNYLHPSPFRIININFLRYLTKGRGEDKIVS